MPEQDKLGYLLACICNHTAHSLKTYFKTLECLGAVDINGLVPALSEFLHS